MRTARSLARPAVPGRLRVRRGQADGAGRPGVARRVARGRPGARASGSTRSWREQPDLTPYDVAAAVNAANPPGGLLFVGASNPIRDLDLMATAHPVGERRMVLANRGPRRHRRHRLDARSAPRSAGRAAPGRSRTSATSPSCTTRPPWCSGRDETAPGPDDRGRQRRRRLDLRHPRAGGARARGVVRPALRHAPRRRPRRLCAATRTPHWRVSTRAELEHALASPNGGIEVVEAAIRRDNRRELDEAISRLARPLV